MLRLRTVKKTKQNLPWWLEQGVEICPACGHTYVYQTEYRCVECDGPVCSVCVTRTIEMEFSCPTCISPEDTKSRQEQEAVVRSSRPYSHGFLPTAPLSFRY